VKRHVFHPEAAAEYAQAVNFYREIDPALAIRFHNEMERIILAVRRNPEWFWLFDPPARRHFSLDFPYACIYLDQPDRIWIVAVMHMKQQPGYWRTRAE
jgi:toxin ParE1/3/4